jgi:two-component system sensor histidine kinase VicK
VTIGLDCPADIGEIDADQGRVEQVILNFLSNAIKYSPEGGTVTLRAERGSEQVRISVSDQGIGIPEESVPQMFGRYARVESERHKGIKGIGLGLFLAKVIIEAQQGSIGVQSRYGEGSTFYFTLPAG